MNYPFEFVLVICIGGGFKVYRIYIYIRILHYIYFGIYIYYFYICMIVWVIYRIPLLIDLIV